MQHQDYYQNNEADFHDSGSDDFNPMQARGGPPPKQFYQNGPPNYDQMGPPPQGYMNGGGPPPQYGGPRGFPSRGRGICYYITP